VVAEFSRLDEMSCKEHGTKQDAESADNNVRDAQERILATHNGARGDQNGFGATVCLYWKAVVDLQPISARSQDIFVIALGELTEGGQTGRSHPDLERLPRVKIWKLWQRVVAAVDVLLLPIGRRNNIRWLVLCLTVEIALMSPRSSLGRHVIYTRAVLVLGWIGCIEVGEGVVEHRVGNETTGIVWLAIDRVQGPAVARINVAHGASGSFQLLNVHALNVTSVVLVEVGQAVVEQNGRLDVVGDLEAEDADAGVLDLA